MLQFRRQHPDLFRLGSYIPLNAEGKRARHMCAFARQWPAASEPEKQIAIIIVPRLIAELTPPAIGLPPGPPLGSAVWEDTRIILPDVAPPTLRNVFTGQTCPADNRDILAANALADFPVAVLCRQKSIE